MLRKVLLATLLSLSAFPVLADSPYRNNLYVDVGAYWANADTSLKLSSKNNRGTRIDVENILGLEDSDTLPFAQIMYRFNDRHALEFSYIDLDREGTQKLDVTIDVGDNEYTAGTTVFSRFRTQVFRVGYRYAFFTDADKNLEIGAGLHTTRLTFSIEAQANWNGGTVAGTREGIEWTAPLPAVGVKGAYRINDSWLAKANFDFFALSWDNYAGQLISTGAYIEYGAFKHFGLGAGYQYNSINVDVDRDRLKGYVDYSYTGPMAYASFYY